MNDVEERLIACFQATFPKMKQAEIQNTNMTSVEEWDSLATITLMTLIEESFAIQIDPAEIENLTSFPAIRSYLLKKTDALATS